MNKHLLSFDFESWIFSEKVNRKNLSIKMLRKLDRENSKKNLLKLLKDLKNKNQKITFFLVFRLEEMYPGIIELILREGHEIGWHGHTHAFIRNKEILISELEKSKEILSKYKVKGFQAPGIIFFKEGYGILKKYGFSYSSSIYGNTELLYNHSGIYEIPVSTSKTSHKPRLKELRYPVHMSLRNIVNFGIPYGSSYFWSILGKNYYKKKFEEAQNQKITINMFIHNWQIIPEKRTGLYKEELNIFLNPLFYPYTINVKKLYDFLITKYQFQKFSDYLYEKKGLSSSY